MVLTGLSCHDGKRNKKSMTQNEKWIARYNEVVTFIETNKRNPSKYDAEDGTV